MGLQARIWASRLGFSLEAGIWVMRLGFGSGDWDLGLKPRGGTDGWRRRRKFPIYRVFNLEVGKVKSLHF